MDFPFSDESVQEESLISMDEDISGAVFRTGKPWCGSVQEARRQGMKDTARAEVGMVSILPLVVEVACWDIRRGQISRECVHQRDMSFWPKSQIRFDCLEKCMRLSEIRELKDKLAQESSISKTKSAANEFCANRGKKCIAAPCAEGSGDVAPTDSTVLVYGDTVQERN